MARLRRHNVGYVASLGASFVLAMIAGYTALGRQIDTDAYDWLFRLWPERPASSESILLSIDESSLNELGGIFKMRAILAAGLERISRVSPKVVAIDLTLADAGDPEDDRRLQSAMANTPGLVLAAEMLPAGDGWQEPLVSFRRTAAAVGHVHAAPDELDGVNRQIPLEKVAGNTRHWALSLEAYRLSRGGPRIVESPDDIEVGGLVIPAARDNSRSIFVRYRPAGPDGSSGIPAVSVRDLLRDSSASERFRGRVVFVGVTAQSAARDRMMTPVASLRPMPGVEIHANAFETLSSSRFLTPAPNLWVVLTCALLVGAAGAVFAFVSGWPAYLLGALLLLAAHGVPYAMFAADVVFPMTAPLSAAWLSVAGAASYQHFVVRRRLEKTEKERARYQQAVHFVTHEMRTPLTAIQGSSELMSRYNLSDDKRKQIAGLIHSESRRLGKMVETFLNVERLSAGQMELRKEPFNVLEIVAACSERARPLAEKKQIRLVVGEVADETLTGDRELMEYAVYNLINNAVKYSPSETQVTVMGHREGGVFRLIVRDQGIGMDQDEVKNLFHKFYRTRKAIDSGEAGTGIGLSIVEQIITQHGGRIEVESEPGKGSCFTLVLPATVTAGSGGRES